MFTDFEKRAITLLLQGALTDGELDSILAEGTFSFEDHTSCGYLVSVTHAMLPRERTVYHEPIVIGKFEDVVVSFVIFAQDNQLTLEISDWGEENVPPDFRERDVRVRQVRIVDGAFVSLT